MMLGNLSIKEIQQRSGVEFPEELINYMQQRHQSKASGIAAGKWHCFEIPFNLVCGDMRTAKEIYKYLKPLTAEFSTSLTISIVE